jgi:hypothetical protein
MLVMVLEVDMRMRKKHARGAITIAEGSKQRVGKGSVFMNNTQPPPSFIPIYFFHQFHPIRPNAYSIDKLSNADVECSRLERLLCFCCVRS